MKVSSMLRACFLTILAILCVGVSFAVRVESGTDELEQNRALLEKWRNDPQHYARLRQDLRAFLALPVERQAQLRELDHALHEEDSVTYARLHRVLERYADWFQNLPEARRRAIESTPDGKERVRLIKDMRLQEWLEHLPKAIREEVEKLSPDKRQARIAELRKEERQRRDEWRFAMRHWDELMQKRAQLPPLQQLGDVKTFMTESLLPMLSAEEKKRLQQAQGHWPLFPQTLVELADKHPIKLPGPTTGPARFADLPLEVQKRLPFLKNPQARQLPRVQLAEGKWPDYAMLVSEIASRRGIALPQQLGPSRSGEFSNSVRMFLEEKLLPRLAQEEKTQLKNAEGHWPQYPRLLRDLARKHSLPVPGMGLPGPNGQWDRFRLQPADRTERVPDVPDDRLREFMRTELSPEERAELPSFSLSDWDSRDLLKQAYFRRYPGELKRLHQADMKKQLQKPKE